MQSMTGFGRAERSLERMDVIVEIRTLNSRYLDLKPHLPKGLLSYEPQLRKEVQSLLDRGRVEVTVNFVPKASDRYQVDQAVVQNYLALGKEIQSLGIEGQLNLNGFLQLPGVLTSLDSADSESFASELFEVLREALGQVVEGRAIEGRNLKTEIDNYLRTLEQLLEGIRAGAEGVFSFHRQKLRERIDELEIEEVLDEGRLAQEMVYYARRSDISEEIARLQSHISRFHDTSEDSTKSIGKNLDFLCQEMNREISTILAKSPLPETSDLALKAKGEIEKIREQVQNVE